MAEMIVDGFRVDAETGEVLGLADLKPEFAVNSVASAEWVMEKFSRNDADKLALAARRAALNANLDYEQTQIEKRGEYLAGRFTADLKTFAEKHLEGMKQRFIPTAFGRLQFRKTPGSIKVLDMEGAVAWAKKYSPDAVKTVESVLVSKLNPVYKEFVPGCFEVTGPGESFKIETGVKA